MGTRTKKRGRKIKSEFITDIFFLMFKHYEENIKDLLVISLSSNTFESISENVNHAKGENNFFFLQ